MVFQIHDLTPVCQLFTIEIGYSIIEGNNSIYFDIADVIKKVATQNIYNIGNGKGKNYLQLYKYIMCYISFSNFMLYIAFNFQMEKL